VFEAAGRLDRQVEGLGGNDDLLRRGQDGQGLTRPELAVLLATAKLTLQDAIEHGHLGDQPELLPDLYAAFPRAMRERFADAIEQHRLRGEIVATKLANRIVNRLGILHPYELAEEEGASLADIAAMFVVAERLFGLGDLWARIETETMPEAARIALFEETARAVRTHIADLLRANAPGTAIGPVLARLSDGVAELDRRTPELLLDEAQASGQRLAEHIASLGAPADLTLAVVRLFNLDGAIGLADLGKTLGLEEVAITRAFTALGQALGLDWAQGVAVRFAAADQWERLLLAGLARDFEQLRLDFLAREAGSDPVAAVEHWITANATRIAQFKAVVARARLSAQPTAAMLAQIAGQARVLLAR